MKHVMSSLLIVLSGQLTLAQVQKPAPRLLKDLSEARLATEPESEQTGIRFRHHYVDANLAGDSYGTIQIADLDQDGKPDIILSQTMWNKNPRGGNGISWYRNVKGDGSRWEKHVLPDTGIAGDFHSLIVADFDGDGDLDIVTGTYTPGPNANGRRGHLDVLENLKIMRSAAPTK